MQIDYVALLFFVFEWLLFSIALYSISGKLQWEKRARAFVPGIRLFAFADSVDMNKEGTYCGVMDILMIAALAVRIFVKGGRPGVVLSLLFLILFLFYYIYRIQVFLKILAVFGLRKRWVILWLVANWLPILILGFGKKYQPQVDPAKEEEWMAGTKPADIPAAEKASRKVVMSDEGLSIDLRERSVKEHRQKRYLLKDIALNIPNKSLVLLLGGSGSGKTTLVNAVIGYEKADATVLLNGEDVYKDYSSVMHKIGFVQQKNLIRGKDTVIRTVDDAAKMRLPADVGKEKRNSKILEVMELLGLVAGEEGLVEKKSGGQLRRISIAMELVADPDLLILDEPDSGLDGVIAREIFTKLRGIADEGRIVIVITHTPDRVVDLFDKVIVLARDSGRVGRLAFYGSPDEARAFFERDTMEHIVMSINSKEEGGEGRADELIERFAKEAAAQKGGEAS